MPSERSNRHAPESRQGAVQPYESKGPCTYAEVAREPGVDAGTPSKWVARAKPSDDAERTDNPFQTAERLRRPQGEDERLKRENEMLSEASAFFASRQPWATPRRGRSSRPRRRSPGGGRGRAARATAAMARNMPLWLWARPWGRRDQAVDGLGGRPLG